MDGTGLTRRGLILAGVALAGASGALGVACGGAAGPPEARRTEPVTLEAWSRLTFFKGLADEYNAGPGKADLVTLNPTLIGNPLDFQNKLITAAASNTTPDFTTVELNITPGLNVQKIYADVGKDFARLKQKVTRRGFDRDAVVDRDIVGLDGGAVRRQGCQCAGTFGVGRERDRA